jgi:hypothetical protein
MVIKKGKPVWGMNDKCFDCLNKVSCPDYAKLTNLSEVDMIVVVNCKSVRIPKKVI